MWDFPLFPDQASSVSGRVDAVYFAGLGIVAFFTTLICVLMLGFAVRYRKGSRVVRGKPVLTNIKLEAAWIVIPLVISVGLFSWASVVYFELYSPPGDAAEIDVVGKQWMWTLQHPEGKSEINELHLPLGRPVKVRLHSQDVIHSFFVPAFRVKQDVVPGRTTEAWFRPIKVGRYHLFCAEYCGTNHSTMGGWVVVMEPADYEAWLTAGPATESIVTSGRRLFETYHCSGCHDPNSTFRAPSLVGVFGGQVPIMKGEATTMVTADDRYIRDSIYMPKSEVVAGYEPIMPSFQDQMPEEDLLKIVAYIKSLGRQKGAGR